MSTTTETRTWTAIELANDLLGALRAVIGHGYCEQRHPSGQDLVSKDAIAQVRAAIARAELLR